MMTDFDDSKFEPIMRLFSVNEYDIRMFMEGVANYLGQRPDLRRSEWPVVHSYKMRLKDPDHLRQKLARKLAEGRDIHVDNFFSEITDLAGVRILLLFQSAFAQVDAVIRESFWRRLGFSRATQGFHLGSRDC